MSTTRRQFLLDASLATAALGIACRSSSAPAVITGSSREVVRMLPGMPTVSPLKGSEREQMS